MQQIARTLGKNDAVFASVNELEQRTIMRKMHVAKILLEIEDLSYGSTVLKLDVDPWD